MTGSSPQGAQRATGHVFIAASIDGYIARANGDIDWLDPYASSGEDTGYDAFMASVDGLVLGRGTFEKALSFGAWPFARPVVVASRSLSQSDLSPDLAAKVRISSQAPTALLQSLGEEGWKRVYVDGGKLIQSYLAEGLISDIILTRVPILLGSGIPLFAVMEREIALSHKGTVAFASGLVQSRYEVVATPAPGE